MRFVGRAAEVAELRSALDRARGNGPVTVLVSGEAGMGKTRLVSAALGDNARDALILTGACLELGTDSLPYTPFVAILRQLDRQLGPEAVDALLPSRASALTTWLGRPRSEPSEAAVPGLAGLLADLLTVFERLARKQPLVLVVEDLHWADTSSRELVTYLARNLRDVPVLLVVTFRTGELSAGHPTRQLLSELGRRPDVAVLELAPFTVADVREQLAALVGTAPSPAYSHQIHQRSGGNPLFVEAIAQHNGPPDTLRNLLLDRIAALKPPARELLATLAVAGTPLADDLLGDVTRLSGPDLATGLRELSSRRLILISDDTCAIRHDLIRETLYADLLPLERKARHGSIAAAISTRPGCRPAELAGHWFAAGQLDVALPAAWRAAALARETFAYDEELNLLQRILDSWDELPDPAGAVGVTCLEVLEHAVEAADATGQAERGFAYATAALDEVDWTAEPERAAMLLGRRGHSASRMNGTGSEDLRSALELLPPGGSPAVRAWLLSNLSLLDLVTAVDPTIENDAIEALRLATEVGEPESQARARLALNVLAIHAGATDQAVRHAVAARELATAQGNHHLLLTAVQYEMYARSSAGDNAATAELGKFWWSEADRLGRLRARGSMLAQNWAAALVASGRWDECIEVVDEALSYRPPALYERLLLLHRAQVALWRGEREQFAELIQAIEGTGEALPRVLSGVHHLRARAALTEGDPERADHLLGALLPLAIWPQELLPVARLAAEIQRARRIAAPRNKRIGAETAARLAELEPRVESIATTNPLLAAEQLTYRALTGPGRLPDWDRAIEAWRALDQPYEVAAALVPAAEVALATSNKAGARQRLTEARQIATGLGARPLLDRIERLADRAGLSAADEADPEAPLGLTRRELDVLRVLAAGRSNPEIAAELFISPNTVGSHLVSIFAKLDVTTRTEAAAAAYRAGLLR